MNYVNMTREGERKLHEELKELKEVKRPIIMLALQEARRKGDLSENAEYDAAKHEKAFIDSRINHLEKMIRQVRIIDDLVIDSDKVYIGARVEMENLETGEDCFYILVNEVEADFPARKISTQSPIGRGLLGKGVGDTVEITIPKGTMRYRIKQISR